MMQMKKARRVVACLVACLAPAALPFAAVADAAKWVVVPERSEITYLSSKMTGNFSTVFENNRFTVFSGSISNAGEVKLEVDLNSVDTRVAIRDERVREHVFDVKNHPRATIGLSVGTVGDKPYPPGYTQKVEASLTMRGVTGRVGGEVSVVRTGDGLLVQTVSPILVNAADYGMTEGFETLKDLVKLFNVPTTIPVSLKLFFAAK